MLGLARALLRGRSVPKTRFTQLSSKRGPRNFYKGTGARTMGRHTRKGGYILEEDKMPTYVVPDLTSCKLKPYVSIDVGKKPPKGMTQAPQQ